MTITATAAGLDCVVLPPRTGNRLVLLWHLLGTPGSPAAMAAALPLREVDAWRAYLPLPPVPEGADVLVDRYAPLVETALAVLPDALADLRAELGVPDGPVDLVGGSAGGHIALLAAARALVPVRRVAAVNPATDALSVVTVNDPHYEWSPRAREVERDLRVAPTITAPVLIVRGAQERPAMVPGQNALARALPDARLLDLPDLAHMVDTPERASAVDREVGSWLA
ncbi:hypothetical protein KCV87_02890 [Actinosynnema pretiosum subsp. pretiosum]|uniref:Alpha/beta hydrolase n=2 Tax=Actinosynnema TaxID=40566 RepID=C6W9W6_ACTMD|nr:hypothetical protein [Actinosynnema mirum]ACU37333.1 hypothetical protein Amir_3436 [Actinosynnema mirum DSM 43827]AXX30803.1 hypothetical protein APASM_3438 [Actinosynnema pretiosum subsp. pretiosum]QUF05083.1 hypothetical protein KCV87_02890 [Actinosynnema pretiosum subsp. pretiosum]